MDTQSQGEKFLKSIACEHTNVILPADTRNDVSVFIYLLFCFLVLYFPPYSYQTYTLVFHFKSEYQSNVRMFEVKRVEKLVSKDVTREKTCLTVNISRGDVTTGKDRTDNFTHAQVEQLIKSRSDKTKLGIRFEGKKRRDYIFSDTQVRSLGEFY